MLLALLLFAPQAPPEPEAPRARGWSDFPVFVWRERYAGKPLPEELIEPFGGVILMRDEDSVWARARGLSYLVWNAAGRDALHLDADETWNTRVETWIETRDERLLVREPCLNDPATIAGLHATLARTIAKHGAHPGLGFVLGDEVSLTPNGDPFDLCRCGHCEARWKVYAEARGLPERAPLTDEVLAGLRAKDHSRLGAWMARRRFDQDRIVEVIEELSRASTRSAGWSLGGAYAGLLGCKGQTAFGGVALERVVGSLGLVECYPLDSARELAATTPGLWRHALHGSTGPDDGPSTWLSTIFLGDASPAELAWSVYDAWLRGASGLVLWSDADLAGSSSDARTRLTEAVATIRSSSFLQEDGATETALRFRPGGGAIAVVRDADATALSFLRDALGDGATWPRRKASYQHEHGRLERKVEGWMRLIEDCQLEPAAIALSAVCGNCRVGGLEVLVLPEVLVLGDDDIERLSAYVAGGGWLVIDGTLGWVDRDGRPRDGDGLRARLGGAHPARVLDAPSGTAQYLDTRLDLERGEELRRFVLDLPPLVRARANEAAPARPTFSGEAARVPWLVRRSSSSPARREYTLLPNYENTEKRRSLLRDLPLDGVRAPAGHELEWILPAEGKVLRAGDVARVRLRPRAR